MKLLLQPPLSLQRQKSIRSTEIYTKVFPFDVTAHQKVQFAVPESDVVCPEHFAAPRHISNKDFYFSHADVLLIPEVIFSCERDKNRWCYMKHFNNDEIGCYS
ncbi:hypothetical protein BI322_13525 [Klebsiella oxytoca]|nr:hypothetical protein BI322_13525 [Klebsiella oxytoca]GJK43076.1 hypothetical protein TUM17559_12190 [Enterobacter cloacae]GJL00876.1 hypothetical protein TUM17569_63360 [Klebsiella oxytoca]GJL11272.1 hypothetical protein TUM17572_10790 [Klebsiella oxytoca]SBL31107.1 ResA resolvase [Klebsiella grimontii]